MAQSPTADADIVAIKAAFTAGEMSDLVTTQSVWYCSAGSRARSAAISRESANI